LKQPWKQPCAESPNDPGSGETARSSPIEPADPAGIIRVIFYMPRPVKAIPRPSDLPQAVRCLIRLQTAKQPDFKRILLQVLVLTHFLHVNRRHLA
jgi:hypothetical protein